MHESNFQYLIPIDVTCLQSWPLNSFSRIPHSPDQLSSSVSYLSEPERILHLISCTTPVFSPHCSDHLHKPGQSDNMVSSEQASNIPCYLLGPRLNIMFASTNWTSPGYSENCGNISLLWCSASSESLLRYSSMVSSDIGVPTTWPKDHS